MLMLMQNVMLFQKSWEMLKHLKNNNKPRFVMTLSKSSMIIDENDNADKDICVLISQYWVLNLILLLCRMSPYP